MQVFSKEEFSTQLARPLDQFLENLADSLPAQGSYCIPADSGRKTALAKLFANHLFKYRDIAICITGWNVWQSCEHLDLFYGYRKSHGENRILFEAPVHLFNDETDKPSFISIVSLILYFIWDAQIFDRSSHFLLRLSNDEFMDVYANEDPSKELNAAFSHFELQPFKKSSVS